MKQSQGRRVLQPHTLSWNVYIDEQPWERGSELSFTRGCLYGFKHGQKEVFSVRLSGIESQVLIAAYRCGLYGSNERLRLS